ncbi:diaminobutyrate--2-oxoglutarate transaminase [Aquabacterium sp. A7-Y]|uniref:diaminobutyrate--2-oxoglutarate transaminase n=1 Tax=Aquabacterium sp. A7-Y TaxID=1349605 RepID=UPI00223DC1A5|nr:diaminobutyrate--2-oxoglutarate transaminase [Aquabacterium sp. A7-Y]MCW7539372.1 diaminobutyrate--2-oxoglutarate transaminase [Aquabacterium sp. A7-Y]
MDNVLTGTDRPRAASAPPLTLEAFCEQRSFELRRNPYLERQEARESNARSYPRRIPLALQQGQGIYLRDTQGHIFIDCLAGAGTLALGHNHPATITAMRRVLDAGLPLHTLDLTTPVKDAFVEALFDCLPEPLAQRGKIQFCGPTGADAIEAALKLVKTATGRRTVFAFSGAYHGMTQGALGLTGNLAPKLPLGSSMGDVHFLPYPYDYRCPFGLGGEAGVDAGLHYIEHLLDDPESGVLPPAAVVVEAVQGEGGVIPAPARWLRGLRDITRQRGIALVVDEVQTGLGRTGRMFACEHAGITPDVLVLSKAIGGGLPLSVLVYDAALDRWAPGAHAGTFRGNQLAMAAGIATLQTLRHEQLTAHAAAMGERLTGHLLQLQREHRCIGEVRGRGLMLGMELVDPDAPPGRGRPPQDGVMARLLQQHCLRQGVILELGGRHSAVVRLLPPLIISAEEVDVVAERIARALQGAWAERAATRPARATA